MTDWLDWHRAYDRESSLSRRLRVVRARLQTALDDTAQGEIRLISVCAGQGYDVIPVVAAHPRRAEVRARLVELDPENARIAAAAARAEGLDGLEVVIADAALTASYAGSVPARIVLGCGVFGNINAEDIERTIAHLPELCAPSATVIWTRGASTPDLRPTIRRWFVEHGFEEQFFQSEPEGFGVGVHRLVTEPQPFEANRTLFTFTR